MCKCSREKLKRDWRETEGVYKIWPGTRKAKNKKTPKIRIHKSSQKKNTSEKFSEKVRKKNTMRFWEWFFSTFFHVSFFVISFFRFVFSFRFSPRPPCRFWRNWRNAPRPLRPSDDDLRPECQAQLRKLFEKNEENEKKRNVFINMNLYEKNVFYIIEMYLFFIKEMNFS